VKNRSPEKELDRSTRRRFVPQSTESSPTLAREAFALQRTIGNAATTALLRGSASFLQRDPAPTTDPAAAPVQTEPEVDYNQYVAQIPPIAMGSHFSPAQAKWMFEGGKEYFGSYEATVAHFKGIENSSIGVPVHREMKSRIEAVAAAVKAPIPGGPGPNGETLPDMPGGEMPLPQGGFQHRIHSPVNIDKKTNKPEKDKNGKAVVGTERFDINSLWMHDLGFALDYDATNLPMLQNASALIAAVTGAKPSMTVTNAGEDPYSARRARIENLRRNTEDPSVPLSEDAKKMLQRIPQEFARLVALSKQMQGSLGANTDAFLDLRRQYFEALALSRKPKGKGQEEGLAKLATIVGSLHDVVKPWTDRFDAEQSSLDGLVTAAAPLKFKTIPDDGTLRAKAQQFDAMATQAEKLKMAYATKDLVTGSADDKKLTAWESKLEVVGGEGQGVAERVAKIVTASRENSQLAQSLLGYQSRSKNLHKAREHFTSFDDPKLRDTTLVHLFGQPGRNGTTAPSAVDPSAAQLIDTGFVNDKVVKARFLVELARHGFDMGVAWGGESTDTMHMELVVGKGGAVK
jgi:hypothetical protein